MVYDSTITEYQWKFKILQTGIVSLMLQSNASKEENQRQYPSCVLDYDNDKIISKNIHTMQTIHI